MLTLSDNQIIMVTSMISSIILYNRKGFISEEELLKKIHWIFNEITIRKGILSIDVKPNLTSLRSSLKLMDKLLEKGFDSSSVKLKAKSDFTNILLLAFYRNNLIHLFFSEACIACSLLGFGEETSEKQGISI